MSFILISFTWEEYICKSFGTSIICPPDTSLDFRLRSCLIANTQCNLVSWYSELGGLVPAGLNSKQSISIRLLTSKAMESHHLMSSRSASISKAHFISRVYSKPYLNFFWVKSTCFFFLLPRILCLARKRRSLLSSLKSYSLRVCRIVRWISRIVCLAHLRYGSIDFFLVALLRMVFLHVREGFPYVLIGIPDYLEWKLAILPSMGSYG